MHKIIVIVIATFIFTLDATAQTKKVFTTNAGAINGYDPVAYFTESKAIKGRPDLIFTWDGASWHFASQSNLDAFKADPEKYSPQFGGFCAYGAAHNHKSPTDQDAWTIIEGKLYFNYDKKVQAEWKKDTEALILKANKNWKTLETSNDE